ncbi:MAG: sugar transferase [Bacilli bacterium]|nr:sugar transferase [Bacilli bacterium]
MSNEANVLVDKDIHIGFRKNVYFFVKRLFDLLCALVGCTLLIPIALIVKIFYIITGDFNSIFFTQKRIGQYGEEFNFFKFRTMVPNADEILFEKLNSDKELAKEYKENKKLKNDPRITKAGKILRRTSLDELPQLINVLKGDMSMIGNRPYIPREKRDMGKHFSEIVKTRPGITGYWQVSGRENASFKKRLELEKYYSNNQSFLLDIKIFFKTFKAVLGGHGAAE